MKQTSEKRQSGFTMIEIMVVVVIVAILAAIAVPTYVRYVESARASEAKSVIGNIDTLQKCIIRPMENGPRMLRNWKILDNLK